MKVGPTFCAIIVLSFVSLNIAAPSGILGQLEHCRSIYNAIIGHINSSEGEEATAAIWRLLFHDMDVDGDEKLTPSDIALFLEKKDYVHETDVYEIISEAAAWIHVGGNGDGQLSITEFVKVIEKTVAEKPDAESSAKYAEITASMCHLFTNKVPHIAESMVELETCAKHLDEAILSDKSRRAEFNSWSAIFETMDINKDKKIDFAELKHQIGHTMTDDDDISLANALGHAIYGTVHHDVKDINEQGFYVFVHELLYGDTEFQREKYWGDVTTEHELRGRVMLCKAIRDVRKQLTGQRNVMNDCIKSYLSTKQKLLGKDGVFAPEIVFTMVDANKDGEISHAEFDAFIGSQSILYNVIERKHAAKAMKIDEFRSVMPDEIVEEKKKSDVDAVLELTSMTSPELHEAEKLCHAIVTSVQQYQANAPTTHPDHGDEAEVGGHAFIPMNFKGSGEYIDQEHISPPHEEEENPSSSPQTDVMQLTDQHGNPFELSVQHPSEEDNNSEPETDSFKGMGHYEWIEHELPHPHEDNTTHDTLLTPPSPSNTPSQEETGIVYHMIDSNGYPIEVHLSQIEIDDIVHRMAMAQAAPVEPKGEVPEQNQDSNADAEHSQIVQEIERILLAREEGEVATAMPPPPPPPSTSPPPRNEQEDELKKLLEDMEKSRQNH